MLVCTSLLLACDSATPPATPHSNTPPALEWRHYLGDKGSSQYSALTAVNRETVSALELAWQYDPKDAGDFDTQIPTNPLIVNGVLYGLSARKNLFALNAATGEELWVHQFDKPHAGLGSGRGLVYWEGHGKSGLPVAWIIVGLGHQLFAVDAHTGERVAELGSNGYIDLRFGLDRDPETQVVRVTSPGTLYKDLLIQGFGGSEMYGAAPGYIRAYHLPSGELRWTFRTIPALGELGSNTWPEHGREQFGGTSSWAGITVDEQRGIAFVPTSSPSYDFYGADRQGDNLFANSLVALDAATGERLWHYQIVRHDLWDRDLPTPPNLVTVRRDGVMIPAVSQATKSGHVFVFHRETGEPLFPIEETAVSGEPLAGEFLAPTQPLPSLPPAFTNQTFEPSQVQPSSGEYIAAIIDGMKIASPYTAPSESGVVLYPGMDGGAEWGGQSWDEETGLLFVNANEIPWYYRMLPLQDSLPNLYSIEFSYLHFCGGCHGADRRGSGDMIPSLRDISDRYWPWEVFTIARHGRGRMPGIVDQPWYYLLGPVAYLYTAGDRDPEQAQRPSAITGYMADGYHRLRDANNLPGSTPPWGTLTAIDMNEGEIAWRVPLGDYPQALALGMSGLGAENYGGPVATAGGLVFIAATPDRQLRAFDKLSGDLLWEHALPASGFATPAIYEAEGRQFIVVAAGGGKLEQPSGSAYVAFALPKTPSPQRLGTEPVGR